MGLMNGADPLQLGRLGVVTGTALEIQKAKTQNIYFTAIALIAGAVIIGAFK